MWAADEQYVRDAADVHQVISWVEEEGRRCQAMYALYAVIPTGDGEGLVWLAGVNPTDNQANFDQRHPVDVDPVWGTPAEVYTPSKDK